MTNLAGTAGRRGGPLLMLALLLTAWTGARALWWENPFAGIEEVFSAPIAGTPPVPAMASSAADLLVAEVQRDAAGLGLPVLSVAAASGWASSGLGRARQPGPIDPQFAAAHQLLWRAGLRDAGLRFGSARSYGPETFALPERPPFLPPARRPATANGGGRWSVDGWAFWRQGSDAAPISQGRVPIYGASQVGAVLQYRIATTAARDPRLYARAYRALVPRGEQELALGASPARSRVCRCGLRARCG